MQKPKIRILEYLFLSGETLTCRDAADANDDGRIDVSDTIRILLSRFQGKTLPAPTAQCGADGTEDSLDCPVFRACDG